MKLLLTLLLFFMTAPAWATFTLVQAKNNAACNSTTCTITVTSTGAGHGIIVGTVMNTGVTIASVSGGGTYTLCGTTCQKGNATTGFTDMAYTTNSTSGATAIVITFSVGESGSAFAFEVSSTGTIAFDAQNGVLQTTNCTSCTGASLTLSGSNDFIGAIAGCGGACSAVSPYTADNAFPGGEGQGHALNTASGTAPTWTQSPTNPLASVAIAFKDATGGTVVTRGKAVIF